MTNTELCVIKKGKLLIYSIIVSPPLQRRSPLTEQSDCQGEVVFFPSADSAGADLPLHAGADLPLPAGADLPLPRWRGSPDPCLVSK